MSIMFRNAFYFFTAFAFYIQSTLSAQNIQYFEDEYKVFSSTKLRDLHTQRADRNRTCNISLASEVLDFIAASAAKYNASVLAGHSRTYDLLIDLCDIVNLQDDDFKATYTDDITALGFDFYAFDRFAKIVNERLALFGNLANHRAIFAKIITDDLPLFADVLINVKNQQLGQPKTKNVSGKKVKASKFLCLVAGDFLSFTDLDRQIDLALSLPSDFTTPESREAFLAYMVRIGESSKSLSRTIKESDCTLPWDALAKIRDCIVNIKMKMGLM